MKGVNKVTLVGRIGKDPEVLTNNVVKTSMATTRSFKNKDGLWEDETEWHNLVLFGNVGKIAHDYVKKGSLVYVEGSIKSSKYDGKDGVSRTSFSIIVRELQILTPKNGENRPQSESEEVPVEIIDDEIPF